MTRGRKPAVSEDRLLVELQIHSDRSVFAVELEEHVDVGKARIRQILNEKADEGLVEVKSVSNRKLYRLTEDGKKRAAEIIRESLK